MSQIPNSILSVKVTADLSSEPVTLAEVKAYGNITYADYDTLLTALLKTACIQLENACGRSFGVKTIDVEFTHNGYQTGIRLPQGPLDAITALQWRPCRQEPFTDIFANTDDWELEGDRFYGNEGHYKATYTTTAEEVTEDIKTAIKAQTIFLFNNRDNEKAAQIDPVAYTLIFHHTPGDLLL
jgi:uncharacterized phiE125 gp8 family phage protein